MVEFDVWNAKDEIIETEDEILSIIEQLTAERHSKESGLIPRGEAWRKGAQYAVKQKKKQCAKLRVAIKKHNISEAAKIKEQAKAEKAARVAGNKPEAERNELFTQALKDMVVSYLGKDVATDIFSDCGAQADRQLKNLSMIK